MDVARWARDGGLLGLALPAATVGPVLGAIWWLEGRAPPRELGGFVAYLTLVAVAFGIVGGGGAGALVAWLDRRGSLLAWALGVPLGVAGGLVATLAYGASSPSGVGACLSLLPAFVAACSVVTVPTHAVYLAVHRRGRSGVAPLALAVGLALVLGGPALVGGLALVDRVRLYAE